ncbi:bifunctional diaminohydroxyphosphoribosylaminopyrimidine deaminase/5-amino-6-(5-phosphoribosylamino)uracil reductase RibD [Afifella pfennigii]|uniref:bifunctional diaminohydroxyphosphoribosylaminopyrimidine deaminase/5-amino-6-(5-phosphoribosylamino)uracil reductase RibD n=1 Tax=Afifella pfennigii TaxID=209897 RepID=UPI000690610D|nr:bifunctional diaminohydroxyphosphoribosylaminopyrimidine deaminase/5-amino-6-(5-phosphoribosylamino)uracil reductase RibD [Afifella pfennigii]
MSEAEGALDARFLAAAIRLGRLSLGETAPNPAVGAILVKDGKVVGRGRTALGGRPHAETVALARAGEKARGATLYVSLEPCNHFGLTPPCTEAVVRAGVGRVVVGLGDPDSRVAGKGIAALRQAGIEVCERFDPAAGEAHRGHISRLTKARPFVTLKLAVSADGAIGITGKGQVAVTGEIARRHVHALRARVDAILVGAGTVRDDDPALTCRLPGLAHRSPIRLVLSASGKVPEEAGLFREGPPTWLISADEPPPGLAARMRGKRSGLRRLAIEKGEEAIPSALGLLAVEGITSLLVEGGARTAAAFLQADCVDEVLLFQSPAELGAGGVPALAGMELSAITQSAKFNRVGRRRFGEDMLTRYLRAG